MKLFIACVSCLPFISTFLLPDGKLDVPEEQEEINEPYLPPQLQMLYPGSTYEYRSLNDLSGYEPKFCNYNLTSKIDFNPAYFAGRWFLQASSSSMSPFVTCWRSDYRVDLYNHDGKAKLEQQTMADYDNLPFRDTNTFSNKLSDSNSQFLGFYMRYGAMFQLDYNVIDTDYSNYAIVYTCDESNPQFPEERVSVLSRGQFGLPPQYEGKVGNFLASNGWNPKLFKISQQQCEYDVEEQSKVFMPIDMVF